MSRQPTAGRGMWEDRALGAPGKPQRVGGGFFLGGEGVCFLLPLAAAFGVFVRAWSGTGVGRALSPSCVWWDVSCGLLWGEMLSPPPPAMHAHLGSSWHPPAPCSPSFWGCSIPTSQCGVSVVGGLPAQNVSTVSPSSTRQLLHALEIPVSELIINHSQAHGDGIRLAQGWFTANTGPMGHPMVLPL